MNSEAKAGRAPTPEGKKIRKTYLKSRAKRYLAFKCALEIRKAKKILKTLKNLKD